jgi:hypothetical protein
MSHSHPACIMVVSRQQKRCCIQYILLRTDWDRVRAAWTQTRPKRTQKRVKMLLPCIGFIRKQRTHKRDL